ncbi:glycosyl hydrolases family 31-domain-containing protein [Geopyxis carbonaria]|nr:glycosyl hydrolases family 31-domain-containing protein [Geopyxis carbonaria]
MWIKSVCPLLLAALAAATPVTERALTAKVEKCGGYAARNVRRSDTSLSADLKLVGKGCAVYGKDLERLRLEVNYDSNERLHVKIIDPEEERYQVPEFTLPRPAAKKEGGAKQSDIVFKLQENPFAFSVVRKSTGEKLFDTTGNALVFEEQYIRLATNLPSDPNIYGLGEHTETFRLPNKNFTRTIWNRDAYGVPANSNLYGAHPVYFEHRKDGTHGVFMLNSNGMDIKLDEVKGAGKLEYNIIGGIIDLYFVAGPTPEKVAQQYSEISGKPTLTPYWGLGNHQCRYGYRDWIDVAEVVANYSSAGIPLETMWTDIDYMYERWVFTLDPDRFPLDKMRTIVDRLHANKQNYIVMVDPAIAYQDYDTFNRGVDDGVFLKESDGTIHKGVVWPGVTVFPDWFHPNVTAFWNNEFAQFFDKDAGVDIDGIWIDMNEPASFCDWPCADPEAIAKEQDMPPKRAAVRTAPRPIEGFPETYNTKSKRGVEVPEIYTTKAKRGEVDPLIDPPYDIANEVGGLSDKTVHTDIVHYDGHVEYDVHNLYGTSMSTATYDAALARRPSRRPFIITRSTFVGAGTKVGKWLGDNLSTWHHYRNSISGVLSFASIYQIPLVGADVCGFGGNTTSTLCARWTTLGAFAPFYRNHNGDTSIPQEPYLWPIVASAAKNAINIRYAMLDYLYTALHRQSATGTPAVQPLWFQYPKDSKTYPLDLQYLYGPSLMVAPVTAENETSVAVYFPEDVWYDYHTHARVAPGNHTLTDIDFDQIPLFVRGGSILPLRKATGAMTTAEVRERDFELLVFPGKNGEASGELYLDDGDSLVQKATSSVTFEYKKGKLSAKGSFGYKMGKVGVSGVTVVGKKSAKKVGKLSLEKGWSVEV